MIALLIGTPNSGKSERAEKMLVELADRHEKIYIATMIAFDEEGHKRIRRHRAMREGKGFETVECPYHIGTLSEVIRELEHPNCLLECMSNLIGNWLYLEENKDKTDEEIENELILEVVTLAECSENMVIVSNEFKAFDESYDEETIRYVRVMHEMNEKLKKIADRVEEVRNGAWVVNETI